MPAIRITNPVNRIGTSTDYVLVNSNTDLIEFYINGTKVGHITSDGKFRISGTIEEGGTF